MKNSENLIPSFGNYAKSMGTGVVVAPTWLGAGDLLESATAGGKYGYALIWSFVLALLIRFLFVSIISKYQLFNPPGESVIADLSRVPNCINAGVCRSTPLPGT